VLLLESIAQCGAVAVLSDPKYAGKLPLFGGVESARFRRQVVPGDTVLLECEMTRLSARGGKGHGRASVDGRVAVESDLLFVIADAS
jgi:3-hydroxyacyl-[acyl-carrier-protein] dehydratase